MSANSQAQVYKYSTRHPSKILPGVSFTILSRTQQRRIVLTNKLLESGYYEEDRKIRADFNEFFDKVRERMRRDRILDAAPAPQVSGSQDPQDTGTPTHLNVLRITGNEGKENRDNSDNDSDGDTAAPSAPAIQDIKLGDFTEPEFARYRELLEAQTVLLQFKYRPAYMYAFLGRIEGLECSDEDDHRRKCRSAEDLLEYGDERLIPEIIEAIGTIGLTDAEKLNLLLPTSSEQPEAQATPSTTAPSAEEGLTSTESLTAENTQSTLSI